MEGRCRGVCGTELYDDDDLCYCFKRFERAGAVEGGLGMVAFPLGRKGKVYNTAW